MGPRYKEIQGGKKGAGELGDLGKWGRGKYSGKKGTLESKVTMG